MDLVGVTTLRSCAYMKFVANPNHDLALLTHPLGSESAFTPQALIEAVRAKRGLVSVAVPEVCILEFDGDLTDHLVQNKAVSSWPRPVITLK